MTDIISEKDLKAMVARVQLASPGPWEADPFGGPIWGPDVKAGQVVAEVRGWGYLTSVKKLSPDDAALQQDRDKAFIAAARTDMQRLIDEVRRLTADRDQWKQRFEAASEEKNYSLTIERDNLKKMLEDSNQREQLLIGRLQSIGQPDLAYICAECGGFAYAPFSSLDSGTTFNCEECKKDTIVDLKTVGRYCTESAKSKADAERMKRLEAVYLAGQVFAKVAVIGAPIGPYSSLLSAGEALKEAVAAVDPMPVPMCREVVGVDLARAEDSTVRYFFNDKGLFVIDDKKPDALADLFPPGC